MQKNVIYSYVYYQRVSLLSRQVSVVTHDQGQQVRGHPLCGLERGPRHLEPAHDDVADI